MPCVNQYSCGSTMWTLSLFSIMFNFEVGQMRLIKHALMLTFKYMRY